MKYCMAQFKKEIPSLEGVSMLPGSLSMYQFFEVQDSVWEDTFPPEGITYVELSELEATEAVKFVSIIKDFRNAYSDVEGLEPDEDQLEKRKTRVYYTDELFEATVSLMKKHTKRLIQDEFDTRESRDEEQALLDTIEECTTVRELNLKREELLGISMPKAQLQELGEWDDETNSRITPTDYNLGF